MEKTITINPLTKYYHKQYPKQSQNYPGLSAKMTPKPDCGEESYIGHGRLLGKKALVTGGDSGIGRAAAIAFAREGADVALSYLPEEQEDALEVQNLIKAAGRKAVLIPGDLRKEKFASTLVQKAHKALEGLDILTFVAGKQHFVENIEELTTEQLKQTFEVNVFSLFWLTKAALPYLKPGASIITTTSIQAFMPSAILLDYAATKSAIIAFTKALAKQLAPKGIRVNSVAPGPVWTPLQISGGQPQEKLPGFGSQTPMKRAGQPVELSGVYVLLASDESSYTTAEVYGVTGGLHTS